MTKLTEPRSVSNDPKQAGRFASRKITFGNFSRYAVAAVHTRFGSLEWFVWDAQFPSSTGETVVIRQKPTFVEAVEGLE